MSRVSRSVRDPAGRSAKCDKRNCVAGEILSTASYLSWHFSLPVFSNFAIIDKVVGFDTSTNRSPYLTLWRGSEIPHDFHRCFVFGALITFTQLSGSWTLLVGIFQQCWTCDGVHTLAS